MTASAARRPDGEHRGKRHHDRKGQRHAVHVYLGMHLVRLEMNIALNRLLDRLPNLRLDPDGDDPHIRGQVFRSPTSLPVRFGPRSN